MRKKEVVCIICPLSCRITVYEDENGLRIEGNKCPKGEEYAANEIMDPKRVVATSVKVLNGNYPLVSVRTDRPISKKLIFDLMKLLKGITVEAPVRIEDVIVENILDTGADVIATRNVERVEK